MTFLTGQGSVNFDYIVSTKEALPDLSTTTSPWFMTRNFIYIQCALWSSESDITDLILLEVPPERVTAIEELGRGAFGRVYKSVMRKLPEKTTSSKRKEQSLDLHEGRIVATKVLRGAWIQNMAKRWLILSADVSVVNWFTGVTLDRFQLFNPIGSKYFIV